ncbi:TlyA family RNA methyltransferase [Corynebacterium argentoratense]
MMRRVDVVLVERGLCRSREAARSAVLEGRVRVDGLVVRKPSVKVLSGADVCVEGQEDVWASRGALKLLSALEVFEPQGLSVRGRRVLDAGASTGGFTDVVLSKGAREVVAVDVGHDQLIPRLVRDPRVLNLEGTNLRGITPELCGGVCDAMVGDVSFISLRLVLPAIAECLEVGADALPMVKPQFEVGKDRVGAGGVVRDPALRHEAVMDVVRCAVSLGFECRGVVASAVPGPSGNVEFFLWLRKVSGSVQVDVAQIERQVATAIEEGPQ